MQRITFFLLALIFSFGCISNTPKGSFEADYEILCAIPSITILRNENRLLAMSPELQGRVFTSSSTGMRGKSLGYFDREKVLTNQIESNYHTLGGEARFWFGPEIGDFSIFFEPGVKQDADHMNISEDLTYKSFRTRSRSDRSILCEAEMRIRNAAGTIFHVDVERSIDLHTRGEVESEFDINLSDEITDVGFTTETTVTNTGSQPWNKETGLLPIWDIGCMNPSAHTTIIIPLKAKIDTLHSYFSEIKEDRVHITDKTLYYRADACFLNKIGVPPSSCTGTFGYYNPERKLLTIVKHDIDSEGCYVNNQWERPVNYDGDAINIFNGEVNPALDRHWNFFEVESLSPAKELEIGEAMTHRQSIYHFEGEKEKLSPIAEKVLGITLSSIPFL